MKMVSAAKFARAERELKQARPYGEGASGKPRREPEVYLQLRQGFCQDFENAFPKKQFQNFCPSRSSY